MTREGDGWSGDPDQTWGGAAWSEGAGRDGWSDTTPDPGGWYDEPAGGGWEHPTEEAPRRARWPFVVAALAAILVVAVAGLAGLRLADRGGTVDAVGASTTTVPSSTARSSSSTTSTSTSVSQVYPAAGGGSRSSTCTKADLARDIGWGPVAYLDCYGDWAVVSWAQGSGDGGVVRLVDGRWTGTRYGPSSCLRPGTGGEIPSALKRKHLLTCGSTSTRRTSSTRPRSSSPRSTVSERPSPSSVPAPLPAPEPTPEPTPEPIPTPTEAEPIPTEDVADAYGEGFADEGYATEDYRGE